MNRQRVTYKHPTSEMLLHGIRLGAGTIVRVGDKYDSTDGQWREMEPGSLIEEGATAVIVREVDLSPGASALLRDMVKTPCYLVYPNAQWNREWKKIFTAQWRPDPRFDQTLGDQQAPQELRVLGLIALRPLSAEVYEPTSVGREVADAFRVAAA